MKYTNELMLMIAKFLYGEYDAAAFSFDFPTALANAYDDFTQENEELCAYLEDEMPELCASFDPHETGEADTLDEKGFREKVLGVYQGALPMSLRSAS
nr:MAG TPA: hypothetical protein [Caudoviricetes sp.]